MTSSYNPTPNLRTARDEHRIREAAPVMLKTLERFVRWLEVQNEETDGFVHCLACNKETDPQVAYYNGPAHEELCPVVEARAAIAKARGEPS